MGAWGPGSFQNDQALEWLGEIESQDDPSLIDDAIDTIVETDEGDHLDADDCQTAIVAAELVAALGGQPSPRLPDGVKEWADEQEEPDTELVESAIAAIVRIRTSSELLDLFSEDGGPDTRWLKSLDDLTARLKAAHTTES